MKRLGFSLIELMIVIAILVILASLLQPSMDRVISNANRIQCNTNLKHLLSGFSLYENDNLVYPYADTENRVFEGVRSTGWVSGGNNPSHIRSGAVWDYVQLESSYLCPSDNSVNNHIRSYSVSGKTGRVPRVGGNPNNYWNQSIKSPSPSKTMIFVEENDPRWFNMGSYWVGWWTIWGDNIATWHDYGMNMGYMDGHADYTKWEDPLTITRFVERGNFRSNPDMISLLDAYHGGTVKP